MENLDRRYLLAGFILLLIIIFAAGVKYAEISARADNDAKILLDTAHRDNTSVLEEEETKEEQSIQVYVCGEVEKPGVFKLNTDARVYQVVEMAVPCASADLTSLDMARKLADEDTIVVPAQGEASVSAGAVPTSRTTGGTNSGKVNINRATAAELAQELNGIGPALSQRIVDYRESNGPFKAIEDIKNVSGIGDKKFEAVKEQITVR